MHKIDPKDAFIQTIWQFVDTVAKKDYRKLASIVRAEDSWCARGKTQEEAFLRFGEVMEEHLAGWGGEDNGYPYVVDAFRPDHLDFDEKYYRETGEVSATYQPTSNGEELVLWFEFSGIVHEDGTCTVIWNMNA